MADDNLALELNVLRMQLRRIELEVHALGQKVYATPTVPQTKADAADLKKREEERREREQKERETPVEVSPEQWEQGWMTQ